jgi:hypothetical protein
MHSKGERGPKQEIVNSVRNAASILVGRYRRRVVRGTLRKCNLEPSKRRPKLIKFRMGVRD